MGIRSRTSTNARNGLLVNGLLLFFGHDVCKRSAATLAHTRQFLCSRRNWNIIPKSALGTFYLHFLLFLFLFLFRNNRLSSSFETDNSLFETDNSLAHHFPHSFFEDSKAFFFGDDVVGILSRTTIHLARRLDELEALIR